MKRNLIVYFSILSLILASIYILHVYNKEQHFFFIQMSDPQFGFIDANKSIKEETILYEKAIANINRLKPDFVVITGDFVHDHTDSTQWSEFNRITGMIKKSIPVYLTPGNHEYNQNPTEEDFAHYKKIYGDDKFSFKHKRNLFIGLNTSLIKTNSSRLEKEQFEWLESELEDSKNIRNIVVFTHYPFFINDPNEKENKSNIDKENRIKYLDLFNKFNVRAVFAGHLHRNSYADYKGMDMISTSAVGKQLSTDISGLRIIKVLNDSVVSNYYSLQNLEKIKREDILNAH